MPSVKKQFPWLAFAALALAVACSESDTVGPGEDEPVIKGDDRTPPQTIIDLGLSYSSPGGSALLAWTAPADDDTVDHYEIRYSYSFPLDWAISVPASNPPVPGLAGEPQQYEFPDPRRGSDLYAAIRSFDAAGNASLISPVAHAHIDGYRLEGLCVDAVTRAPLQGLDISVTERRVHSLSSAADGRYRLDDLAGGVVNVTLRSGSAGASYHNFNYSFGIDTDTQLEHAMIQYVPTDMPAGDNVLRLLFQAVGMPTTTILKKWRSYPVGVYVPPFINDYGFDYEDYCRRAALHWNERTGWDIFVLVDTPEASSVEFAFKTPEEMAPHNGITHHENDAEGFPLRSDIDLVTTLNSSGKLWSIAVHELGHAVRLHHLAVSGYMMYPGQPLPDSVTDDEVRLVQLYMALPNETVLTVYEVTAPE